MSVLTLEKTRVYGYNGGPCYRASVNGQPICVAKRKDEATDKAVTELYRAFAVAGHPPAMAMLNDGRFMIGMETTLDTFSLFYFTAAGKQEQTSCVSNRQVNGAPCTLQQFVTYNALMHNGLDYAEAAKQAMEPGE